MINTLDGLFPPFYYILFFNFFLFLPQNSAKFGTHSQILPLVFNLLPSHPPSTQTLSLQGDIWKSLANCSHRNTQASFQQSLLKTVSSKPASYTLSGTFFSPSLIPGCPQRPSRWVGGARRLWGCLAQHLASMVTTWLEKEKPASGFPLRPPGLRGQWHFFFYNS